MITADRLDFLRSLVRDAEQDRATGQRHFTIGGEPDNPAIVNGTTVVPFRTIIGELFQVLDQRDAEADLLRARLETSEERVQEEQRLRADMQRALAEPAPVHDDTIDRWHRFLGANHCVLIRHLGPRELAMEVEAREGSEPVSFATADPRNLLGQFLAAFEQREAA